MPSIEEKKVCLSLGCGKPPAYKGLCMSCYKTAKGLVEKKETTWEALAEMGLVELPVSDKFLASFKQKQKDQ